MFGIILPPINKRDGWSYEGNFIIVFTLPVGSVGLELARRYFAEMNGYAFFGNNLFCFDKTLFGANFDALGDGVVTNNKDHSNDFYRPFIPLSFIKEIMIDDQRMLWPPYRNTEK